MTETRCEHVRDLLIRGEAAHPAISAHVVGCPRCRGALATLLAERYAVPAPAQAPSCEALDDLPAYLDCERAEGEATAAVRFPHVWWHLWVCPACAEEARLTRALLTAEAGGELAPVPATAPPRPGPARQPPRLSLDGAFLSAVFAPQAALGAAWGDGDEATLVAEESDGFYRVALYARPAVFGSWNLSVVISPTVRAVAVLSFGAHVFRAAFDRSGTATVVMVPAALLTDRRGPRLEVRIEPHEA